MSRCEILIQKWSEFWPIFVQNFWIFFFFWKIWLNFFLNLPVSFFFARYNFFPFSFASFKTHFLLVFQENRQIIRRKSLWRKIMSLRPHRTSQSSQCEVGRCRFRRQHGSYWICLSHEIRQRCLGLHRTLFRS